MATVHLLVDGKGLVISTDEWLEGALATIDCSLASLPTKSRSSPFSLYDRTVPLGAVEVVIVGREMTAFRCHT